MHDSFVLAPFRCRICRFATGVIIGGAFQSIVTSVINDLVMPFVGVFTGGVNFVDQFVILRIPETVDEATRATLTTLEACKAAGVTTFNYGAFITALLNFLIMAFVIFMLVKFINKVTSIGKKKVEEEEPAPTTKNCPFCCSEIAIEATRCPHCTSNLEQ